MTLISSLALTSRAPPRRFGTCGVCVCVCVCVGGWVYVEGMVCVCVCVMRGTAAAAAAAGGEDAHHKREASCLDLSMYVCDSPLASLTKSKLFLLRRLATTVL